MSFYRDIWAHERNARTRLFGKKTEKYTEIRSNFLIKRLPYGLFFDEKPAERAVVKLGPRFVFFC